MMNFKIYLSGKITGNDNYLQDFEKAEKEMAALGFTVVNPTKIVTFDKNKKWRDYMKEDIKALVDCDAIFLLKNWRDSRGARLEYEIAHSLGLYVMREDY